MTKRYFSDLIYLALLTIAILLVLLLGMNFVIRNNPRAINNDLQRLTDFNQIATKIDDYYNTKKSLPSSLDDIDQGFSIAPSYGVESWFFTAPTQREKELIKDPVSNETYKIEKTNESGYDYKLCTTFESDWNTVEKFVRKQYSYGRFSDAVFSDYKVGSSGRKINYDYKKGYNCLEMNIIKYNYPTPTPYGY